MTETSPSRRAPRQNVDGLKLLHGHLDPEAADAVLADLRALLPDAPLMRPMAPWGKPLTVRMTNAGALGWVTDRDGYRYQPTHPETGRPWPPIPETALAVWRAVADCETPPDCCLINHYEPGSRLGLHRDDTEADTRFPVVSISLGDPATFRIGGLTRAERTWSVTLGHGDVCVLGGGARLLYHGIDRIKPDGRNRLGAAPELGGGRISLTLRRAGPGS